MIYKDLAKPESKKGRSDLQPGNLDLRFTRESRLKTGDYRVNDKWDSDGVRQFNGYGQLVIDTNF